MAVGPLDISLHQFGRAPLEQLLLGRWIRQAADEDQLRLLAEVERAAGPQRLAARQADPTKRREDALQRDLARIRNSINRLLTAYQDGLLSLDELRERMPSLRRRDQATNAELQAIVNQSVNRAAYLRLAETLTMFLARLRSAANTLEISERQRILRLLVKEILLRDDKIIIRHCIPLPTAAAGLPPQASNAALPSTGSYLLRSRSQRSSSQHGS